MNISKEGISLKNSVIRAFSLLTQVAIYMLVPIIMCLFLGKWLDEKFNTNVLFLVIFIILGVLSSFRNLYVLVIKQYKPETKEELIKNLTEYEKSKEQKNDKNI